MEIIICGIFLTSSDLSFFIALATTLFCFIFLAVFILRSSKKPKLPSSPSELENLKPFDCACAGEKSRNRSGEEMTPGLNCGNGGGGEIGEIIVERHTGASMMEQLVPEITTHALSYLDYPSLCRLSMTNSHMRKAANDDNAWKALYHKDFTLEQDSLTPVNGWKAYYAATRAIVNTNVEFFRIITERSLPAMGQFWLNVDYVKCFHATGESFTGYNAVMESWQLAFSWENVVDFQIRDVRARVLTDMAWVTMKAYLDMETGPFNVTNVYEFHSGRWYMVHHHSSAMLIHGGGEQQFLQHA
ncbi:F-box protein SKIP8 isoform X2 [Olea europaea var. sylvestris]|uniref:F-box protein SKIP8 isoform X2 n=1 Tax=Olea europaea var. sylvestris TaxID=158386 RepID=UPI000C1D3160|nr:F-box protein SKIP8 isoform X2 [Olea europaea var. sylvestris]XP_022886974.1 F-box protein SKIP8 isoform X2 [Olea europaea var. sylvestris]XP_022886975.1 F-box protein SKIP8 isoform X2 [Olea europaea var. sylvestris]